MCFDNKIDHKDLQRLTVLTVTAKWYLTTFTVMKGTHTVHSITGAHSCDVRLVDRINVTIIILISLRLSPL